MADNQVHITTNSETIQKWVEERKGYPAMVLNTVDTDRSGILKIGFTSQEDKKLDEVSWDHFFDEFEENNLAFKYQEEDGQGEKNFTYSFVDRDEHKHLLEK